MHFLALALLFLSSASQIMCVPQALNASTLRQNALDAQKLNSEFESLNETDPCDSGLTACIGGALAQCLNGSWEVQKCAKSLQCFAIPSVRTNGTVLTCTSEASALSLIQAAGVPGGLFAQSDNTSVALPTSAISSAVSSSTPDSSGSSAVSATGGVVVVTVTVTEPLVLPTETFTLSPQDALSIISSLSAEGFTVTPLTTISPSTTLIPTSTSIPGVSSLPTADSDCTMAPAATSAGTASDSYPRRSIHLRGRVHL